MPSLRRFVPLLLTASLAVAPAPALAQGGAGDDQYADPFGGGSSGSTSSGSSGSSSGSTGSSGTSSGSTGSGGSTSTPSAPAPSTSTPSTSSGSTGTAPLSEAPTLDSSTAVAPTATGVAAPAGAELPRTGMDAWVIALLGVGLLVAGIGLRLRTVDGRRA